MYILIYIQQNIQIETLFSSINLLKSQLCFYINLYELFHAF